MADNGRCSEYRDFSLETYRHASRYGDSPCERPFLPRRGIFFWPMEKSKFDQRRFLLWTRVLRRMEKDKILISIEEPSMCIETWDTRYHFHPNQYRPPFYKAHKLRWPHVKEWYFEFMNSKNESMLLSHSMARLEAYLDSRDRKDGIKKDVSATISSPMIRSQNTTKIMKFPLVKKRSAETSNVKDPKESFYFNVESPDCSETSSLFIPKVSGEANFDKLIESSKYETNKIESNPIEESRRNTQSEYQTHGVITCKGCSRCAYRTEFPDDLFEGRIHQCLGKDQTKGECEYIICHECKRLFDDSEMNSFKKHLESPDHTRNYLLRLQKSGKSPTKTSPNKKRLANLSRYATHMGYASVSDYMRKIPLGSKSQVKLPSPPRFSDSTNAFIKPKDQYTSDNDSKSQFQVPKDQTPVNPQSNSPADVELFIPPSIKHENTKSSVPDVEKDLQEFLEKERDSLNIPIEPKNFRVPPIIVNEFLNISPKDNYAPNIYSSSEEDLNDTTLDELEFGDDMVENMKSLNLRQKKSDKRLVKVEADMSNTQLSLDELGRKVEIGSNRTQALIRSFLRHDDAIRLLQKDAIQGKSITDMMEGAIDAMKGTTKSEVVSNRLDRHEMDIDTLRKELKRKVDDLSCWLKVIDRHTNDINSLKQRVWINGQINDSSDSNRHLIQKLEYQIKIQQEATKVYMMKTEHRFEALIQQYNQQINKLNSMDEEKQRQILHLKSQMGLKFAHMEQKTASFRKTKR
ncbi:hypothetical protein HI914_07516 [Erysiphe necator]|nr:hypothetical protein HI914_07516 [Erysiphe necator]